MKKSNIVSVDLKAFFGSLLEQWKTVVIFAVAGSVLMPCAMSKKINDSAKDEADTYKELSMMSDEEKLHTLPELDCVRVSLALEQKEKALKTLKAAERAEKAVKEFLSRND